MSLLQKILAHQTRLLFNLSNKVSSIWEEA
jgi:hypothetical protein